MENLVIHAAVIEHLLTLVLGYFAASILGACLWVLFMSGINK